MSMSRNQVGDTIIEVMLATAVIGLVIGSSYATATKALRTGRFAQEQTEALKVAESQIEKLKYIASIGGSATPTQQIFATPTADFCVNDTFQVLPAANAACRNINNLYNEKVTYSADSTDTFVVAVTWQEIGDDNQGNVQIAYRLHK